MTITYGNGSHYADASPHTENALPDIQEKLLVD